MQTELISRLVAEELGYRVEYRGCGDWELIAPNGKCESFSSEDLVWDYAPDFCNDHNAAAEIRKAIKPEERRLFTTNLISIIMGPGLFGMLDRHWEIANAEPIQTCEAFLRIRKKWVE